MPSYAHHHSSPLDDTRMDALKCNNNSAPPEETAEDADAAGALVEKDGFSVEDLLDLEEFGEPDKDGAEPEDDDAPPVPAAAEERSKDDSQPLSVVTYDLPSPPPEMVELPSTTTTSSCSSSGSFSPFLRLDSSPFGGLEVGEGYYGHLLPRPPSKKSKHGAKGSKHKPKKRGRKPKHLPTNSSGRGVVLSCTRCQQGRWPPSGGCTFFFLAIMALYRT
ncbi:GATA zinc finger family protein [Zea mays]|uniref:GATA zinc finger family protein n=1 Tax=Zea mays TaxID=4577 RepID=A0A1D6E4G3_MAIZE|nr:GATA zinc finger family protein [Zea mays]